MLSMHFCAVPCSSAVARVACAPATLGATMVSVRPAATTTLSTPLVLSSHDVIHLQSAHLVTPDSAVAQRSDIFQTPCQSCPHADGQPFRTMPGPTTTSQSSGLDFIDFMVNMGSEEVNNRLQDAVTFRMLGCGAGVLRRKETAARSENLYGVNVKKLKAFRDNVTRNLAPTVAHGFSSAVDAAAFSVVKAPAALTTGSPYQPQQEQRHASRGIANNVVSTGGLSGMFAFSSSSRVQPPPQHHPVSVAAATTADAAEQDAVVSALVFPDVGTNDMALGAGAPWPAKAAADLADAACHDAAITLREEVVPPGLVVVVATSASSGATSSGAASSGVASLAQAQDTPLLYAAPATRRRRGSRSSLVEGAGRRGADATAGESRSAWI